MAFNLTASDLSEISLIKATFEAGDAGQAGAPYRAARDGLVDMAFNSAASLPENLSEINTTFDAADAGQAGASFRGGQDELVEKVFNCVSELVGVVGYKAFQAGLANAGFELNE